MPDTNHSPLPRGIVWVASYPKSGNTWVRFLLAALLHDTAPDLHSVAALVPDVHEGGPGARRGSAWRGLMVAKTHWLPAVARQRVPVLFGRDVPVRGVVYVLRSPFDVVTSTLNYMRPAGAAEDAYRARVVREFAAYGGPRVWRRFGFGGWGEHVHHWLLTPQPWPRLVVRYEDLCADPGGQVRRLARFFGIALDEERLGRIVAAGSFARLRQLEDDQRGPDGRPRLPPLAGGVPGGRFFHFGRPGEASEVLSADDLAAVARRFAVLLPRLGYTALPARRLARPGGARSHPPSASGA